MKHMSYVLPLVFAAATVVMAQPPTTPTTQQPAPGQVAPPQTPTPTVPATPPAVVMPTQPAATPTTPPPASPGPLGGSMPTMTPPQMPDAGSHVTDEHRAMMLMLLERIQKLATPPDDSKAGKVSVDRATLDEINAEISQIKTMLQK